MKTVMPDCWAGFACLAGGCRHSCCLGWEIDIDDAALARYRAISGEMGRRLREVIAEEADGTAHFRLTPQGRCPFLNRDGLCDLITALGEDSLCQICADHPRFFHELTDRTEIGFGLCCEAAGALCLSHDGPLRLIVTDDDGGHDQPDEQETALLTLRDGLIARMQDRSLTFAERLADLAQRCRYPARPLSEWRSFLLSLERLDDAWADALATLPEEPSPLPERWDVPFEHLAVYLLFRHLPGALEDGDITGRVRYCVLMMQLMQALLSAQASPTLDALVELCRLYSSEIEYSDENVGAVLDEFARIG